MLKAYLSCTDIESKQYKNTIYQNHFLLHNCKSEILKFSHSAGPS